MPPSVVIPGVAMATSHALDRLARPEIGSQAVLRALCGWQDVAARPRSTRARAHNDWVTFIRPDHRAVLERALVERADQDFRAKTLPNPHADPEDPWWARRLVS